MNILFITEKFPYPLDTGGNVRSYHLLRGLAARHQVTLVATNGGEVRPAHVEHLSQFCATVALADVGSWSAWRDAGVLLRSLFDQTPVVIARRRRPELAAVVRRLAAGDAFDTVYFNHLDAAIYLPDVPAGALKVLDEHNVVTNQVKSIAASDGNPLRRMLLRRDARRVARHEAAVANQMDLCLTCSIPDADALRELGVSRRIVVVPNGVDTEYFTPPSSRGESSGTPAVMFVGTMDYEPCERGVWHFCNSILPLIRRTCPALRFVVVGRNPSARIRALAASDPLVELTGRVEDVRPFMALAQVCVVPLLSGSGTRLKILEAMAVGVPVVSTTIGAEGIEAESGRHLLIADEPQEFCARVVQLLQEPEQAGRVRAAARELVEAKYSWHAVAPLLLQELQRLSTGGEMA